jgi:hypothetical protein
MFWLEKLAKVPVNRVVDGYPYVGSYPDVKNAIGISMHIIDLMPVLAQRWLYAVLMQRCW